LIATEEIQSIAALGEVTADNLRKIGANVEVAVSDWGTMVARRAKKDPPEQGAAGTSSTPLWAARQCRRR